MGLDDASAMSAANSRTDPSRNRYGGPRTPCAAKCASRRRGRHHSASATRAATCSASHASNAANATRQVNHPHPSISSSILFCLFDLLPSSRESGNETEGATRMQQQQRDRERKVVVVMAVGFGVRMEGTRRAVI
jgi:hypothetical protein